MLFDELDGVGSVALLVLVCSDENESSRALLSSLRRNGLYDRFGRVTKFRERPWTHLVEGDKILSF